MGRLSWGGVWRAPENFLNFYIKMMSSGAFSYRLAACLTRIGSTRGTDMKFIGDRSGILGTIILPEENCRQIMTNMDQILIKKNCAKIALFLLYIFPISLKILLWWWVGGSTAPSSPPVYALDIDTLLICGCKTLRLTLNSA